MNPLSTETVDEEEAKTMLRFKTALLTQTVDQEDVKTTLRLKTALYRNW